MDRSQINRPVGRPYNRTCGMSGPSSREMCDRMMRPEHPICRQNCNCRMPGTESRNAEMLSHVQHLEPAMAYVPCQEFTTTFDLAYALRVGTIFPQLCKPFCGKRGGGR